MESDTAGQHREKAHSAHGHQGHGHHGHGHGDGRLALAVAVNLVLTLAEVAGGLAAGSVALIADAVHNLSDAMALVLAVLARRIARRDATAAMSFGYGRAEVVAALVNYTTVIVIALWLGYEALLRLVDPGPVAGGIVIALAGLALVIDLVTAALTWRLAETSANIRAAFLHNLADAGSSLAVILGGVLILAFDWRLADPIVTLGISAWVLVHAATELRPVVGILMLGAPPGLSPAALTARIEAEPGVEGVHHLHLWQIDERRSSVEAHLVLAEGADFAEVLARVKAALQGDYGITHSTFEVETRASGCLGGGCAMRH